MDVLPDDGGTVFELQRRQGFFEITSTIGTFVPTLADRGDERGNGMAMRAVVGIIADIPIDEVRRTHQAIRSNAGLAGKVVKHEDALTQAVGAHLEAGPV